MIPADPNPFDALSEAPEEVTMSKHIKKERPPPVFVSSLDRKQIVDDMTKANLKDFSLKPVKDGIQLYCHSIATYRIVRDNLKTNNIHHFGHDLSADKPFRVVLSGLHRMEDAELKNELAEAGLAETPADIKVIVPKNP